MRAAVIDIGSSTVKLVVGENNEDDIRIIESLKNTVDIGSSVFYKGRISHETIHQLNEILLKYKKVIKEYDVFAIKVIATTAVREANNRNIFLDTVKRKTGFEIEVLNVGDIVYYIDSFLSYRLKKVYPIHERNLLIAELGAGSVDFSIMEKGFTVMNMGSPIGAMRLKQFKKRIDASQNEVQVALSEYIENAILSLKKGFPKFTINDIIVIDENYSPYLDNILSSKAHAETFFQITSRESKRFLTKVQNRNFEEIAKAYNLPLETADSIDGYAVIIYHLFKLIKARKIYILQTSLSEALLANMLFDVVIGKKYNKAKQLTSVVKFLCQKFGSDLKHARQTAYLSEVIFDSFKESLGLEEDDKLYLTLASYLHNIGMFINNRALHKHSEYIINSLSLFRLTDQEIRIIACVARYHRKATPQKSHFLYNSLSMSEQILVQKLSSILRMSNALDSSHRQKIKELNIDLSNSKNIQFVGYAQDNCVFEKSLFEERKSLFEEIIGGEVKLVIKRK